jgi:hypothetical protein
VAAIFFFWNLLPGPVIRRSLFLLSQKIVLVHRLLSNLLQWDFLVCSFNIKILVNGEHISAGRYSSNARVPGSLSDEQSYTEQE